MDEIEPDDHTGDDDNGGGVFGQPGDIFGGAPQSPINPQITRAQEQQPENLPGTAAPEPRRDLVFAQDALGRTTVAWAVNGNLIEAFRTPTAEEMQLAPAARWRTVPQPQPTPGVQAPPVPARMGVVGNPMPLPGGPVPLGQTLGMGQMATGFTQNSTLPAPPPGSGFGGLLTKLIAVAAVAYAGWRGYEWYKKYEAEDEEAAKDEELAEADDVDEEVEV